MLPALGYRPARPRAARFVGAKNEGDSAAETMSTYIANCRGRSAGKSSIVSRKENTRKCNAGCPRSCMHSCRGPGSPLGSTPSQCLLGQALWPLTSLLVEGAVSTPSSHRTPLPPTHAHTCEKPARRERCARSPCHFHFSKEIVPISALITWRHAPPHWTALSPRYCLAPPSPGRLSSIAHLASCIITLSLMRFSI